MLNTNKKLISLDELSINNQELKKYIQQESKITSQDVVNALGYIPATEQTIPVFSLEIIDGDLIMHYADNSSAPLAYINNDGELIMSL